MAGWMIKMATTSKKSIVAIRMAWKDTRWPEQLKNVGAVAATVCEYDTAFCKDESSLTRPAATRLGGNQHEEEEGYR